MLKNADASLPGNRRLTRIFAFPTLVSVWFKRYVAVMSDLEIQNLVKRFGGITAVDGVSLDLEAGELLAILGPSGCGKTTLLRLLAGFETPDDGEIIVKGRVLSSPSRVVRPEHRQMGMVFQQHVLWPHMDVRNNIAYPLKVQGQSRSEIDKAVLEVLDVVGLSGLEKRRPDQLSGGQQQRVALARALAFRPKLLLMDEPLSNLDAQIRLELPMEIRQIQRQLGITTVYVTHDQKEALSIADRLAVMKDGKVVQLDNPEALYQNPHSTFTAKFLGEANFLGGTIVRADSDGTCRITIGNDMELSGQAPAGTVFCQGDPAQILVRPEDVTVKPANGAPPPPGSLRGTITETLFHGASYRARVECQENPALAINYPASIGRLAPGSTIDMQLPDSVVKVFPLDDDAL